MGRSRCCLIVLTKGVSSGGNRNWIKVGLVTFQPSEVAKLGLALYLGVVLATFRKKLTTWKQIMVPGGIASGIVIGLVLAGKDMGTAIVLVIIVCAAYWIAGLPVRFFAMAGVVLAIGTVLLLKVGDTRTSRISVWLNPSTCDIKGDCMQTTHAIWALASGGLWGLGPGMSREKWGGGLPVPDSDFIFAIIGEEFGLIGTLLVLFAFAMMVVVHQPHRASLSRSLCADRRRRNRRVDHLPGMYQHCCGDRPRAAYRLTTAAGVIRRLVAHRFDGRNRCPDGFCARRTRRAGRVHGAALRGAPVPDRAVWGAAWLALF